jgi:hypothetical protein
MKFKVGDFVYINDCPLVVGIITAVWPGYGWNGGYDIEWFHGGKTPRPVGEKRLVKV